MKSVFSMVFAYGAFLLASVAAHATVDDLTLGRVMVPADLIHPSGAVISSFVSDASKNDRSQIVLDVVAAADEEQADSSDAETMLA